MKKNILPFLTILLLVTGCKKNEETAAFVLSTRVTFSITSVNGTDLLSPQNSGSIKADDIDIFYLKKGVKERVYEANLDSPEHFSILKTEIGNSFLKKGIYYFGVMLNEDVNAENISTTYIEIEGRGTDTITAYISKKPGIVSVQKVWYNGTLKWKFEDGYPGFELVK